MILLNPAFKQSRPVQTYQTYTMYFGPNKHFFPDLAKKKQVLIYMNRGIVPIHMYNIQCENLIFEKISQYLYKYNMKYTCFYSPIQLFFLKICFLRQRLDTAIRTPGFNYHTMIKESIAINQKGCFIFLVSFSNTQNKTIGN